MEITAASRLHGHVIVCGMQGLAVRIVELLRSAGIAVVVVGNDAQDHHLRRLQAFDVPCVAGSPRNPHHLWEAGLAEALAVVCAEDDDLRSLEVALLVQELVPDKRVIVRQSNPAVGRAVTSVLTHGLVVNPADLAGPTFVESVLDERLHRMRIADGDYVVRELEVTESGRLAELFGELAPILVTHGDGAQVICPSRDYPVQAGDLVALVGTQAELVDVADAPAKPLGTPVRAAQQRHPWQSLLRGLGYGANSGLKWTVAALFLLGTAFAAILAIGYVDTPADSMDVLDAFYFSIESLATIGYGDFAIDGQPAYLRIATMVVMVLTTVLLAILYALVTDYLVSRRIAATFGLTRLTATKDHVIVVGLGSLGLAVVDRLVKAGQPVVVVERDAGNRHIPRARALGVPVIAQDATQLEPSSPPTSPRRERWPF